MTKHNLKVIKKNYLGSIFNLYEIIGQSVMATSEEEAISVYEEAMSKGFLLDKQG